MVKTHQNSRFNLKSIDGIRDTNEIILQAEKTGSKFNETGQEVYLCEVVSSSAYHPARSIDTLSAELVKVNEENRRLRNKITRLEKLLKGNENAKD